MKRSGHFCHVLDKMICINENAESPAHAENKKCTASHLIISSHDHGKPLTGLPINRMTNLSKCSHILYHHYYSTLTPRSLNTADRLALHINLQLRATDARISILPLQRT